MIILLSIYEINRGATTLPSAKKRRSVDDGLLSYSDLSNTVWQYLFEQGYKRDPDNGDLYVFTGETPFSHKLQYTSDDFLKKLYKTPTDFNIEGIPRESHANNLKAEIRRLSSSRCPFLIRYPHSIGFTDRLLTFENDEAKVLDNIEPNTVISDDNTNIPYDQFLNATFEEVTSWLTDKMSEDGRDRLRAHFGIIDSRSLSDKTK